MARILVTGSAGFIGFHVAKALLAEGHEVVGIDNFNDYYSVQLKRDRASLLGQAGLAEQCDADLCDYETLQRLQSRHRFEIVCHLAAQAGVRYSLNHPFAYQKSNIESFLNILEMCRHGKVPRLVYASSSSVYGTNTKIPFSESDPVDHPVSLYAATKRANELMAHAYTHLYGFQTIGLRFFSVYGPWGRPDMATWLFTQAMLAGKPIKVFNYGDMQRDFTYINDIVQGVVACLFADGLEWADIINLGNNRPEKLMDMIELIAAELGVDPLFDMQPMQPGDAYMNYADITRAQTLLGFQPVTPIREGIPAFIRWYREYHHLDG